MGKDMVKRKMEGRRDGTDLKMDWSNGRDIACIASEGSLMVRTAGI